MEPMLSQFGALTLAQETQFGELPWEILALILLCLPVRARLRAREVSRGWRALLNEPRFWLVLDFSRGSGVVTCVSRRLVFAAGERGRGHVHTLDLTGVGGFYSEDLIEFVAAHGQSLRSVMASELRLLCADEVSRLCRSAPLCTLHCSVYYTAAEALPLLRCEAPCALLHIFKLWVARFDNNQQAVLDFAAALPSHSGKIKELIVHGPRLGNVAVADALMRSIAEAGVSNMSFAAGWQLAPASMRDLTRLLQAGCLETLVIFNDGEALFELGPDLTAFCHALCSSTLQNLVLGQVELWRYPDAADELLFSLLGHPTLRELSLHFDGVATNYSQRAAGERLASLIRHSSALRKLDLSGNQFRNACLAPIFEALSRRSSTLKELRFDHESIRRKFARDVILPVVRANSSLRALSFGIDGDCNGLEPFPELKEAQAIVAARTQRHAP